MTFSICLTSKVYVIMENICPTGKVYVVMENNQQTDNCTVRALRVLFGPVWESNAIKETLPSPPSLENDMVIMEKFYVMFSKVWSHCTLRTVYSANR